MIADLGLILSLQHPKIDQVVSGKLTTNEDGSISAVLIYSGKNKGDEFEVKANFSKDKVLQDFNVVQTKQAAVVTVKE